MLRTRLITAAIALPAIIWMVLKAPAIYFMVLLAAIVAGCLVELYAMYKIEKAMAAGGVLMGVLCLVSFSEGHFVDVLMVSFLVLAALRLFYKPRPEGAMIELAPVFLGVVYIAGMLGYQLVLYKAKPGYVLYLLGTVWIADAAAYFVGTNMGKNKLYASMSPNKTWEGAGGSIVGGVLGALLMGYIFKLGLKAEVMIISGLVIGAVTIVGDLVESMLKRDAGVKDSGAIIPGHGGLLDKLDGSIFAGPVLVWTFQYMDVIKRGASGFKLPF